MKPRVAVLISGRGSNMMRLLAAGAEPDYPCEMALVLSNRAEAAGLARTGRVPAIAVDHRTYPAGREAHEAAVHAVLLEHRIDVVCLAGYMRRLTPFLVDRWAGRMLNIHPSLLPAFPGLDTHARALAAGVKLHGCTVHLVTAVLDDGPILAQAAVPVLAGDDAAALAARVLVQEHRLYPLALRMLVAGTPPCPADAGAALMNPLPVAYGAG